MIVQCVQSEIGLVASNIILVGGNVKFPQFQDRFIKEVRPIVPDMFSMKVSY